MGNRDRGLNVLGLNVRRWREEKGLTQEALAERADLDPTYISGIERGMRNPSVLSVVRIAKALGVTTSQLMERVDDDNNSSNSEPVRAERNKIYSQNNRRGGGNGKKTF
jgi:transcriptional regulator with XRE-family HTH domain